METLLYPYTPTKALPRGNVLILAPHPDDEVFGCAGAIMQHVAQGDIVKILIMTDGRAAITHSDLANQSSYVEQRRQESRQAAMILGVEEPEFWEIADRTLTVDNSLIEELFTYITKRQINQVYAPALTEIHPDHYAAGQIAIEAVARCGEVVDLILYEIGIPLHPNLLLDITAVIERKQQAMACFTSQLAIRDYSRHLGCLNCYRSYTLPASVTAAEAYYVINGQTLQQQPLRVFGPTRQTEMLEHAYHQIQKLNSELSTVYQSRSWWLTTPLRCFNEWVHNLFNKL